MLLTPAQTGLVLWKEADIRINSWCISDFNELPKRDIYYFITPITEEWVLSFLSGCTIFYGAAQ